MEKIYNPYGGEEKKGVGMDEKSLDKETLIKLYLDLLKRMVAEHTWRPVKEKPEKDGDYLAFCQIEESGEQFIDVLVYEKKFGWYRQVPEKGYNEWVTHWRPLPAFPGLPVAKRPEGWDIGGDVKVGKL